MSRQDYKSVVAMVNRIKQKYLDIPIELKRDLDEVLEHARNGEKTYGELLDKINEYEAQYGHAISKQYEQVRRDRNR